MYAVRRSSSASSGGLTTPPLLENLEYIGGGGGPSSCTPKSNSYSSNSRCKYMSAAVMSSPAWGPPRPPIILIHQAWAVNGPESS